MFQPPELPRLPDINPQQTTQDIVNTTSNIGQQAAETSQQAGTEVKNTTDNMTNQIEDIIKQINNLKTELEGKINAVKNCVENEVSKINFQEIKDKIDTLGGLPGKLTELQDKYKYYAEHWKWTLTKYSLLFLLIFLILRYLYKALIGFVDWPYNFVKRRLWDIKCVKCGKWFILWNPFDSREMCHPCRKIADKK